MSKILETPKTPDPIKLDTLGVGDRIHITTRRSTYVVQVISVVDGEPIGRVMETTNDKYSGRQGVISNELTPLGLQFCLASDQLSTFPKEINVEKADQTGGLIDKSRERYGTL